MTSRTDTILLNINDDIQSKLQVLLNSKYSRVPVYEDSVDNIIGILYVKDLISLLFDKNFDSVDLRTILHNPCFVPNR